MGRLTDIAAKAKATANTLRRDNIMDIYADIRARGNTSDAPERPHGHTDWTIPNTTTTTPTPQTVSITIPDDIRDDVPSEINTRTTPDDITSTPKITPEPTPNDDTDPDDITIFYPPEEVDAPPVAEHPPSTPTPTPTSEPATEPGDRVNRPNYYCKQGIELGEVLYVWGIPHRRASAVEYIMRAGEKDPETEVEDLRKAIRNLQMEIDYLQRYGRQ